MNRSAAIALLLLLAACSSSSAPSTGGAGTTATGSSGGGGSASSGGGGSSGGSPSGSGSGSSGGSSSGGVATPGDDAGVAAGDDGGTTGAGACDASACGSIAGFVQRTSTAPTHGGKGAVYIAVFDGNPITSQATATVVARQLLPGEDMTSATAQVAYRVDGVPVRAQGYQVIAFLDDANAVTASNPKPASGDLVSIDTSAGFGGVPVSVTSAGVVSLNLQLNVAMP